MGDVFDTVVVGGGLAGLAGAALLAKAGHQVMVFERSDQLGGRARSERKDGFAVNLGPHALYAGLEGERILHGLGVSPRANKVPTVGVYALEAEGLVAMPGGPLGLLTNRQLSAGEKLALAGAMASVVSAHSAAVPDVAIGAWLEQHVRVPRIRAWMQMLVRVSTYTHAPERLSAQIALEQLKSALIHSVRYVDGGWQSLVDGLAASAEAAGVRIVSNARVEHIEHDQRVRAVRLAGGERYAAERVLIAAEPKIVASLLDAEAREKAAAIAAASVPVRAATLCVQLSSVPNPELRFAGGIALPTYCSQHSAVARLAPDGAGLFHLAEYLRLDGEPESGDAERTLEAVLDQTQPGWRERLLHKRFMPRLTVSHRAVLAEDGGLAGRPGVDALGVEGLAIAGDWVGDRGLLADAALASAERAAAWLDRSRGRLAA